MERYINEKTGECFIGYSHFLTNGKKIYRCKNRFEVIKNLKRLDLLDYKKFDLDKILKNLRRFHPNCPELQILKELSEKLKPLFVGIYGTWDGKIIDYFITYEMPYVAHGEGSQYINEGTEKQEYVSYSTHWLGHYGVPTVEQLQDEDVLRHFLQKDARAHTWSS